MGSVQQIRVKWNHHQSNFPKVFDNLLHKKEFVDVTLACEGQSLKAHKMVLSACSPYFHTLFVENPCQHPIVIMRDFKYCEIEAVVEYMYKGEVNISRDSLRDFLRTAQSLQVKGLADDNGETNNDGVDTEERSFTQNQPEQVPDIPPPRLSKVVEESPTIQREQYSQPTPNKRMRIEKPSRPNPSNSVESISLPLLTSFSTQSIPEVLKQSSSTSHTNTEIVEQSVKLEVKGEQIHETDFRYDDTLDSNTMDESQDIETPEPDTIILGDDPEIIEEEPEIMFGHSNSSQEGRFSQNDNLTSNLISALRDAGAGPSMSSPQSTGEDFCIPSKPRPRHRTSKVWRYFEEPLNTTITRVTCFLCGTTISRGKVGGTGDLFNHLRFKHKQEYFEIKNHY